MHYRIRISEKVAVGITVAVKQVNDLDPGDLVPLPICRTDVEEGQIIVLP
jgi:hypothetical protein